MKPYFQRKSWAGIWKQIIRKSVNATPGALGGFFYLFRYSSARPQTTRPCLHYPDTVTNTVCQSFIHTPKWTNNSKQSDPYPSCLVVFFWQTDRQMVKESFLRKILKILLISKLWMWTNLFRMPSSWWTPLASTLKRCSILWGMLSFPASIKLHEFTV